MPAISSDVKTTLLLLFTLAVAFSVFSIVGDLVNLPFTKAGFDSRFPEKKFWRAREMTDLTNAFDKLGENAELSNYYRSPVLFPADLLVMILLAGTMAVASYYWLGQLRADYLWAALLLPVAYLVADFFEDCLLFRMLGNPSEIPGQLHTLVGLTWAKLITIILSMLQTASLLIAYIVAKCHG